MKKWNFGSLEKYEHGFWTGGIEKQDGSWKWRIYPRRVDSLDIELEDEIPWSFRNWGWLSHSDDVSVLMFLNEKPYFWWKDSGHQPENLNFFICEKESRPQRTKNALAYMNYLVGTDSYDSEVPSFLSKGTFYFCYRIVGNRSVLTRRACTLILMDATASC